MWDAPLPTHAASSLSRRRCWMRTQNRCNPLENAVTPWSSDIAVGIEWSRKHHEIAPDRLDERASQRFDVGGRRILHQWLLQLDVISRCGQMGEDPQRLRRLDGASALQLAIQVERDSAESHVEADLLEGDDRAASGVQRRVAISDAFAGAPHPPGVVRPSIRISAGLEFEWTWPHGVCDDAAPLLVPDVMHVELEVVRAASDRLACQHVDVVGKPLPALHAASLHKQLIAVEVALVVPHIHRRLVDDQHEIATLRAHGVDVIEHMCGPLWHKALKGGRNVEAFLERALQGLDGAGYGAHFREDAPGEGADCHAC
eukprot:CAMPEP_0176014558 /NCGR_PEP_ID=MMETSP0120_2-20121206/6886_1 /TAXON_ID=160619 /ORGANISM="Kryptoperidinium foliaceum, Strain CCMP 1326" /LENGTH=314 /DNA_ID=CAMNT_0017347505 /DNA_START=59 /DNA_END=1001 /DNA_ORIENTATION=+